MNKLKKIIIFMMICVLVIGILGIPAYGAATELDVLSLIPSELLIIAVVIYCIGMFLKASEKIPNWTIPLILLGVAVIITIAYMAVSLGQGLTQKVLVDGVIYGILIAAVAVYTNQVLKQITTQRLKE